jgi:hypothetical protein
MSIGMSSATVNGAMIVGEMGTGGGANLLLSAGRVSGGVMLETGAGTTANTVQVTGGSLIGGVTLNGISTFSQSAGTVDSITSVSGSSGVHILSGGTLGFATLNGSSILNASGGTLGGGTISGINANFVVLSGSSVALTGDISGGGNIGIVSVQGNFETGGRLGTSGASLKKVEIYDGKTLTIAHDIYATNIYLGSSTSGATLTTNADSLTVGGEIDGTIGSLSNLGILNINNSGFTVNGDIGSNTPLGAVNIGPGGSYSINNQTITTEAMTVEGSTLQLLST